MAESKQNLNALRALLVALQSLREAERGSCWGRPLGSRALWRHHDHAIQRIHSIAQAIHIHGVSLYFLFTCCYIICAGDVLTS